MRFDWSFRLFARKMTNVRLLYLCHLDHDYSPVYTSTRSQIRIRIWITIHIHGRGGVSLDLNPVCLRGRVNATNQDLDLDLNPHVNEAYGIVVTSLYLPIKLLNKPLHSNSYHRYMNRGVGGGGGGGACVPSPSPQY